MNVLTIYLPCRKIGIASDLRKVKTAVFKSEYLESVHMTTDVEDGMTQLADILRAQNKMQEANAIEEQYS